jgi:hypothetical protein
VRTKLPQQASMENNGETAWWLSDLLKGPVRRKPNPNPQCKVKISDLPEYKLAEMKEENKFRGRHNYVKTPHTYHEDGGGAGQKDLR